MQIKRKNKNISYTDKKLSIQFSLDGFSFCIKNKENVINSFNQYPFDEKITSPEDLLLKIKDIFKSNTLLQQEFNEITAIHQNKLFTLVPTVFFSENNLENYLQYNIKTLQTDYIAYDDLQNIDAKNVYVPYVNINNYLFQNFGAFEYKHHLSVLIDALTQYHKKSTEKTMYVHVTKSCFDILILQENQLVLANSFSYTTKEDFIYYILFTAEQLQLKTTAFPLILLGSINKDSNLYKVAYKYIKNISFLTNSNPFLENNADFSKHNHYLLLN